MNDKIKEALQNEVPDWDDDLVWDNIEKALPEKKKKRFWIFFFFLALLIVPTISYLYWSATDTIVEAIQKETISSRQTPIKMASANKPTVEQITVPKAASMIKPTEKKWDILTQQQVNTKQGKIAYQSILWDRKEEKKLAYTAYSQKETTGLLSSQLVKNTLIVDTISNPTTRREHLKLEPLPIHIPYLQYRKSSYHRTSIRKLPNRPKRKGNLYASFGIFNTNRKLTSTSDLEWIDQKNELEKVMESSDFRIGYEKYIARHISFSIGLGFRQVVEISEFRDVLISTERIPSDSAYIVNGITYLSGELNQTTSQSRLTKTPNRFRRLYLPLAVGYDIALRKTTLTLEVGTNIDLYTTYRGLAFNYDTERTSMQTAINRIYKRTIGLSELSFATAYRIPISQKYQLDIGLRYLHGLRNHLNHHSYRLTYNHLGAKVGIHINL